MLEVSRQDRGYVRSVFSRGFVGLRAHLALAARAPPALLNLVHPRPARYDDLIGVFANELELPVVPYAEWLAALEAAPADPAALPALRILDAILAGVSMHSMP